MKITSEIIGKLFGAACMGDTETLKTYYKNGGKPNLRYIAFGEMHSLLQGAYNNRQWDTVEFLLKSGETLTEAENAAMTNEYMRIKYMEKIVTAKPDITEDINKALEKAYPNMTEI